MKLKLIPTTNEPKVIFQLKKKLSSLVEVKKERHVSEVLYLALFLFSIDEIGQADELISNIISNFENDEDMWFSVKDAYLLKWSILRRNGDVRAAEIIEKHVVSEEFYVDLESTLNAEIFEQYKYRMVLLSESLEALTHAEKGLEYCDALGLEVLDSHQYLLYYPYFKGCASDSLQSEIESHVNQMYAQLAAAVRAI